MLLSLHSQNFFSFIKLVESADSVIPEHLKIVINRNNEYRRLVEKSVEELLKQGKLDLLDESWIFVDASETQ